VAGKKLKIAVVGCGRVSRTVHYSSIREHSNYYDFVAVCDIDKEKASYWAKENNVRAYYSLTEMLKKEDLDIVSINTPSGIHPKLGIEAAKAGVNVIVEKPMAMNIEDADMFIDACEDAAVKLFVIKQNRYNATNKILKSCVDKGRFGRITTCNVTLSWRREMPYYLEDHKWRSTRDLAGGVFTNQSVHYIDMMQWLIGAPPKTVYAKMGTIYPVEVEDHGVGVIEFKNGVIGSLVLTNHAFPADTEGSITIIGEKGMVKIGGKCMNKIRIWEFSDKDVEDDLIKEAEINPPTVYGFGHIEFYERVAKYLLLDQGEEDIIDGREGRKSVALMDAFYLSDKLGKEIHFPIGKR
jgi:UDP-N-acetyl-2-amino-2-deoxyglucuronate dehydrogenase